MSSGVTIPCIELPNPKPLKIRLPFGTDLKSVIDISKGPPSDCTLIHGLMLQLTPALAGLECVLKILAVIGALAKVKQPLDILDVAKKAAELGGCLNFAVKIPCMMVDILKLIIKYLKCIITSIESILRFQVGINFGAAQGNPVLLASLKCAQKNADASTAQLKEALAVIQPLLAVIKPIGDLAGGALPGPVGDALKIMPDALAAIGQVLDGGSVSAGVPGGEDLAAKLDEVKAVLKQIDEALDLVPC
jgi:hypothetical protein